MSSFYAEDLSYIHHTGFGAFAADAAPGLLAWLQDAGIDGGLVVDLGCGSGLWARALLEAGYAVLGVDCSAAMVALARTQAPAAAFRVGSLYDVELPRCAAVTAIGEPLTYIAPEDPRDHLPALFARVYEALEPGGLFVFDVIVGAEDQPMRYRSAREGAGWRVEVEVEEAPARALLTRRIRTVRGSGGAERRTEEVHEVRTFRAEALTRALRTCGFRVQTDTSYGAMPLAPRRLAFRAHKPGA